MISLALTPRQWQAVYAVLAGSPLLKEISEITNPIADEIAALLKDAPVATDAEEIDPTSFKGFDSDG